jgi:flavodoxin
VNSVVIYASRYGNTQKIAEAIAAALRSHGTTQLLQAEQVDQGSLSEVDLVVVGCPTEGHRMTEPLAQFLNQRSAGLQGKAAAAFDTRLRGPRWLWGSAAAGIGEELRRLDARVIAPEESFLVKGMRAPVLAAGELERAGRWAESLAEAAEAKNRAAALLQGR